MENFDTNMENSNAHLQAHIDEIKSLRDEINWRVKVAYTSIAVLISIFGVLVGLTTPQELLAIFDVDTKGSVLFCLLLAGLISIFIGILNSNYATEKRIELYTLKLQKVILAKSKEPIYSWISFMYGYQVKGGEVFKIIEKMANGGLGLFQFALPNLIAVYIVIVSFSSEVAKTECMGLLIAVTILVFIATLSSVYLGLFMLKLNKEHTKFYKENVKKFLGEDEPEKIKDGNSKKNN